LNRQPARVSRPFVIAHRGTSGRYPENTLPAFRHALSLGVDFVELDVVSTADGAVVVSHDTSVDRTTNGAGQIAAMSLREIKVLDAGAWYAPEFAGERILTLDEALDLFANHATRLCIEIKGDTPPESIETARRTVTRLQERDYLQSVVISSFDTECLRMIKTWEPELATGLDPDRQDGTYTPWQLCQQVLKCHANLLLHRHETLTRAIVDEAHLHGLGVWTWTVNTPEAMHRVTQLDIDAVMTDHPDVLRQYLDHTGISDTQP
jgi:glycerophosphoryl diester phosphodiesterase